MSISLAGAIATALAVFGLVLVPFGSQRVLPRGIGHPERSVLREAGWTRSLRTWEGLRAGVIVCGFALAGVFGVAPIGLIGAAAPSMVARTIAERRRNQRARQTVVVLQMTLASLRSGANLVEAIRFATATRQEIEPGPFAAAMRAFDLGAPLDLALGEARTQARDRRVVLGLDALALCVAEQLPASRCTTLIASAVDRLVFEQRIADDVRARTSGLRVQVVLLAALVPGLALYLALTVPGLAETLSMPLGRFVLMPLAVILETTGIIVSRRVVSDIT